MNKLPPKHIASLTPAWCHPGSNRVDVGTNGAIWQAMDYYPFGLTMASSYLPGQQRWLFGGKELDRTSGLELFDFEARAYDPATGRFRQPDPLAEDSLSLSIYNYCLNNPLLLSDPSGAQPIYDPKGNYLGCTSEGFSGSILIYNGKEKYDFGKFTVSDLQKTLGKSVETMDDLLKQEKLSSDAMSNIWTHVVEHFEGMQVFEETFAMSTIKSERIGYATDFNGSWATTIGSTPIIIEGRGINYKNYESTVENLASSLIVHEWYGHGKHKVSDKLKSHRLAIMAVMNHKLWKKTTQKYKQFNFKLLQYYNKQERKK